MIWFDFDLIYLLITTVCVYNMLLYIFLLILTLHLLQKYPRIACFIKVY